MKRVLASCAAAIALAFIPAQAAEPPFGDKKVSLSARDQPATDFLNQFFAASGLRVAVAGTVTGKINGRFSGHPADIWRQVSSAFNLIAYYDGAVVTVYNANDVQSRTMTVAARSTAPIVVRAVNVRNSVAALQPGTGTGAALNPSDFRLTASRGWQGFALNAAPKLAPAKPMRAAISASPGSSRRPDLPLPAGSRPLSICPTTTRPR